MTVISNLLRKLSFLLLVIPFAAAAQSDNPSPAENSFPKRKAGLWQIKAIGLEQAGMPPTLFCVGEATDTQAKHLDRKPGVLGSCTLGSFKQAQGGWLAESICKDTRTTVKSQAVLTGDLNVEYRIDTVVTYLPPIAGTRKTDQDSLIAKLVGACSATQKPGDLVVPGMGTLNLNDGTFRAEAKPSRKGTKKQR
jgi:hypothetical protein